MPERAWVFFFGKNMNEQAILNAVYTNIEGDVTNWVSTSDDYLTARRWANQAISKWENFIIIRNGSQIPIKWRGLWATLDDAASSVTKTITAGTYTYTCPTDMKYPASYVRTMDSANNQTYYDVKQVDEIPQLSNDLDNWVYFTGNVKDGFTLHFNPKLTLTTGRTIKYEYYKTATTFTATSSTTEMDDPYFIVAYVTSMFLKDDDEAQAKLFLDESEARLDQMATNNIIGLEGVDDTIQNKSSGFGE